MKLLKNIIFIILNIFIFNISTAQTCLFDNLVDDLAQQNATFKAFVENENGFKAWQILATETPSLRTNITELNAVLENLDFIEKIETKNYTSWKLLKDANRTKLMNDANAVEALTRVRANSQLQKLGFIDELLAKVKASKLEDGAFKNILNDLDNFGKALEKHPIEFDNFKNIISKLTDNNPQNSQAAQWIIQDITQNAKEFSGKKLSVEVKIRNSDKNLASIDVATNDVPPLTIEYKWLTSGIVSKDDFIREFIKRDLFNATDLSQIQWRIKGMKLSKVKMLEYLSSKEGREALKKISAEKVNKMLGRNDLKDITELQKNKIADAIIEHFSDQSNFNKVFK